MVKATISGRAGLGAAVGAWVAIAIGVLVLAGWLLANETLKSLIPGAVEMKANAGLGMALAGLSLWLRTRTVSHESLLARLLAVALAVLGGATLVEYIAHINLGIDELLFADPSPAFDLVPGRMSPFTAWCFVLVGTAIMLLRRPASGWIVLVCAAQVLLVGVFSVLGYAWAASKFAAEAWLPPIALNTGLAVGALGVGLIAAQRQFAASLLPERQSPSERSLHIAFWSMVAVLVIAMAHTYRSNLRFVDAAQSVEAAQEVRIELARLHGCLQQIDSAQRRFARFLDSASRLDIRAAAETCRGILVRLEPLVASDPQQMRTLQPLSRDVRSRLDGLEKLAADESSVHEALRPALLSEEARARTRADQAIVLALDAAQSRTLAALKQSRATDRSGMLASLMLTLAFSSFIFALLTRNMRLQVRRSNASREQMESQKALLDTVLDSSPDVIVYKDRDGRVLGCNRAYASFVGRPVEQIVGRRAADFLLPSEAEKARLADEAVLARKGPSSVVQWFTHPSEGQRAMDVVRGPLRDHRGTITGILAIGRDVTDRKKVEEEMLRARALAEEAAQTKSAFLANMSHEIRTPLTGVMGMMDLLSAEDLPPHQKKYVSSARESGRHLLNVINDILDFSRLEKDQLQLEAIDFSIPDMLEQLRSSVNPAAVERGLRLDIDIEPHSPPVVRGDPTRLKQVLLNLAGNAIKFTHAGHVKVSVRSSEPEDGRVNVVFDVQDTGIGIPDDKVRQLFMPFVQADSSIARKYGGSGLGLAISQRLAHAMGGQITAQSEPGEGSLFSLEVPLEIGNPLAAERPGSPLTHAVTTARRILVAEDVEVNRHVLSMALSRQGHKLVFAHNGAEAVALVQQEAFDLVLMDVQMPVMDGVEATRRIRMLSGPVSGIPILGLTANVMAPERERYLAAGMNECLMKPIDWEQLLGAIGRHGGTMGAGEEPATVPSELFGEVPTLDHRRLDALRALATPDSFGHLVQGAVDSAGNIIRQIAEAPTVDLLAAEAHKLKGLAGTMGFAMLSHTAAAIETAAREGVRAEELLRQLGPQAADLDRELLVAGVTAAR